MQGNEPEWLAREFSRNLTAQLAPGEASFFDEIIEAHQRPGPPRRDRTLAFGVSAEGGVVAVALYEIGKIALQAVWATVQPLLSGLAEDAAKQARESVGKKLKKWIEGALAEPSPVALKPEALSTLLDAARRIAAEQGLDEHQSAKIAETLTKAFGKA